MALTSAQTIVMAASTTPGVSQQLGVLSLIGNGIIIPIEFGDTTSTVTAVSDQANGAYTRAQGPARLATTTTYCFYLPVISAASALLNITVLFSNIVANVIIGLVEYVAPNATQLLTQAQSDVPTQIAAIEAAIRALRG